MKKFCASLILLVFISSSPVFPQTRRRSNTPAEKIWVERTLKSLTLREKIGQMMVVGAIGEYKNFDGEKYADVRKQIVENGVGGFVFYRGDVLELASMINEMQKTAKIPLLTAADFERGLPMIIKSGTSFTNNMGIAAAGNPQDAYRKGRIIAEEMRALGINWLYGPVSDVANNPGNTMVNVRSYGENPATTAEFVAAEVRGLRDGGVMATIKHFPGHGDTPIDSHISLPTISINRERLETVELAPVRAAMNAGVDSLMTAHVALPQITGNSLPASLSPEINRDLIRRELKFDGIVTTDSLGMGAIVKNYSPAESAVMAIKAGADIALLPPNPKAAIDAVEAKVEGGEIPRSQIDDSVRRILRAKYRLNLWKTKTVDLNAINRLVEKPANVKFSNGLAERALTLLRNKNNLMPLAPERIAKTLFIIAAGDDDADQGKIFQSQIETKAGQAKIFRVDRRTTEDEYRRILIEADKAERVIVAPFVKRAALKGTIELPDAEAGFIRKVLKENKNTAIVAFGSPYQIQQFPDASVYLITYAVEDVAQIAAARAIFGETAITGRSPVSLPTFFSTGDGLQIAARKEKQKDAKEITEIPN